MLDFDAFRKLDIRDELRNVTSTILLICSVLSEHIVLDFISVDILIASVEALHLVKYPLSSLSLPDSYKQQYPA